MRLIERLEVAVEGRLVFLEREEGVGLLVLDETAGGLALGVQGIGGHHPPLQWQGREQGLELGDLVGLGALRRTGPGFPA